MRDTRKKACLLLLASAGLLPQQLSAGPDQRLDRLIQVEDALQEGQRRLRLEKFLLGRLESVADPGISPSYLEEVEQARKRVFEARAMVLALQRLQQELRGAPQESEPALAPAHPEPKEASPRVGDRLPGAPASRDRDESERSRPPP